MWDTKKFLDLLCQNPDCFDVDTMRRVEPSHIGYARAAEVIPKGSINDFRWASAVKTLYPDSKCTHYHLRLRLLAALMDEDSRHTNNLSMLKLSIAVRKAMKEKGLTQIF